MILSYIVFVSLKCQYLDIYLFALIIAIQHNGPPITIYLSKVSLLVVYVSICYLLCLSFTNHTHFWRALLICCYSVVKNFVQWLYELIDALCYHMAIPTACLLPITHTFGALCLYVATLLQKYSVLWLYGLAYVFCYHMFCLLLGTRKTHFASDRLQSLLCFCLYLHFS